ncbi:DUF3617 domain-containing protein [Sphingobium sp. ZW T5_29]|uniref:DUF3617 domain-containing protein n=1 Tax=Sphingobium sp. ZW T5_29 TaxID=3378077 RepID=UPI0038521CEB
MTTGLRATTCAFAMLVLASPAIALALHAPTAVSVEPGEWELRERGSERESDSPRKLCLSHLRQLVQLRHPRATCKQLTLEQSATRLSVSYDCGGAGSGRTDLRVETPRLAQVRSQGIANGAPFAVDMEARRIGACR